MPKILFIVAQTDFKDEEYFEPKEILENNGVETKTASLKSGTARSANNREIIIDAEVKYLLSDVEKINEFSGVCFVGGSGMARLVNNQEFIDLAQVFYRQNKVIGAICVAPVILANAGILKNKRVTVYPDQENIDIIVNNGAEYDGGELVKDANIITANGPKAAYKFGLELVKSLRS